MGNPINAIRSASSWHNVDVTGGTFKLKKGITNYRITAGSATNIDVISSDGSWLEDGRRIRCLVATGSSTITFRDNQSGTNIALSGLTTAVGALDSIDLQFSKADGLWIETNTHNIS